MDPPAQAGPESGPPHRRLSSEARAARNEAIARRRLEGASVTEVMEEFAVSRNTVKRATRDHAASLARREPEELAARDLPDVEHLLDLGLDRDRRGATAMPEILRDGRRDNITIGAANAASRATSALIPRADPDSATSRSRGTSTCAGGSERRRRYGAWSWRGWRSAPASRTRSSSACSGGSRMTRGSSPGSR